MSITKEKKAEVMKQFQRKKGDTGSPEVQVAVLTERITRLTEHMKQFPKDFHSRYGLLKLVSRRRKLLDYMKRHIPETYAETIKELKIRK